MNQPKSRLFQPIRIPARHNLRSNANKVFKGVATDEKGTMGWCYGFKLPLLCNNKGGIITLCLTVENIDYKNPKVWNILVKYLYGKVFADRGYISPKLFDSLFDDGIQLVHGIKTNMKNKLMSFYDKMMLRKRYIIETINLFKNKAQIVHSRHRSITNFLVNLVAVLGAYCFFENKPDALQGYYIEDSKQLALL